MFPKLKSETELDRAITHALRDLNGRDVASAEYGEVLERVSRLQKLKDAEKRSSQISPDTLVLALTNLVGIAMIIRHEHMNVITTKATGFVMKPKAP